MAGKPDAKLELEVGVRLLNLERFIVEQAQNDLQKAAAHAKDPDILNEMESLRALTDELEPQR